jgi:hypothetical protein
MPTTRDERFAQIEANWFDVMRNYYRDMAATRSEEESRAIEDNYHRAEGAYLDALSAALSRNGARIEAAYADLRRANQRVAQGRVQAMKIAQLLGRLQRATEFALGLLRLAG